MTGFVVPGSHILNSAQSEYAANTLAKCGFFCGYNVVTQFDLCRSIVHWSLVLRFSHNNKKIFAGILTGCFLILREKEGNAGLIYLILPYQVQIIIEDPPVRLFTSWATQQPRHFPGS